MQPLLTFLGLSAFIGYSTFRAFNGANFLAIDDGTNYLSPFFSPILYFHPDLAWMTDELRIAMAAHAWLGTMPAWAPSWVSPSFLILWARRGFDSRATIIEALIIRHFGVTRRIVRSVSLAILIEASNGFR